MKKITLTTLLLLLVSVSFPDRYITRGPNPGEIYFLGPTTTGEGLYYSTDYGMTAVCVDSNIYQAFTITADKTPGVIYYATMSEALYISYDYGSVGSWQYRNGGIKLQINSGLIGGQIYSSFSKHSEDYGINFINHSYNGFIGSKKDVEIDNSENIGYVVVDNYGVNDSLYILISYDNFENLTIQNTLPMWSTNVVRLSRGVYEGELSLFNKNENKLYYSSDFCSSWININSFNQSYEFDDLIGGRNEGEVFVLFREINTLWQNAHIYILHSTDYGITYEVFHPFSKGQEPLLANFSAKVENSSTGGFISTSNDSAYHPIGETPLTVVFYNYSIGSINSYEWDFDNDGIVDSYEENPVYAYQDTGWYSVNLTVYDDIDTNSFLREDYIHAYKITGTSDKLLKGTTGLRCYPNPFTDKITLDFGDIKIKGPTVILIYNAHGEIVKTIKTNTNLSLTWDGTDCSGKKLDPGIYYCKIGTENTSAKKILLTH